MTRRLRFRHLSEGVYTPVLITLFFLPTCATGKALNSAAFLIDGEGQRLSALKFSTRGHSLPPPAERWRLHGVHLAVANN